MVTKPVVHDAASFLCIVLLFVLVTGCDAVGSDVLTFRKEVDFRFDFVTDGIEAGEDHVVDSENVVDFADVLSPEGFTKNEVIAVNVESVAIRRVAPAGTTLDVFDRIAFSVTSPGLSGPVVAATDDPPNSRDVGLEVTAAGITEVVLRPSFRGRLVVVPASARAERYVLTATMEVVVRTEGV